MHVQHAHVLIIVPNWVVFLGHTCIAWPGALGIMGHVALTNQIIFLLRSAVLHPTGSLGEAQQWRSSKRETIIIVLQNEEKELHRSGGGQTGICIEGLGLMLKKNDK